MMYSQSVWVLLLLFDRALIMEAFQGSIKGGTSASLTFPRTGTVFGRRITKTHAFGADSEEGDKKDESKKGLWDFSKLGDLMGNLKDAQKLAEEAEEFNKEFAANSFVGRDNRDQVTATFNGLAEPIGIEFSDTILQLGAAQVTDATMQALTQGHAKAKKAAMERLRAVMTPFSGNPGSNARKEQTQQQLNKDQDNNE